MRKYLVFAASLAIAACNPVAQMSEADSQIEQFHELYSAQDNRALYAMTGPEFREVTTRQQWDGVITMVHQRLGAVEDSSQAGFNINTSNGVTTTVITRGTTFANGEGTEVFTFFGTGEGMTLGGWEVDSEALIGAALPEPPPASAPAGKLGADAASAEMVAKKPGG